MSLLKAGGITSIYQLADASSTRIQLLLNKQASAANKLIKDAKTFPRLSIDAKESNHYVVRDSHVDAEVDVYIQLRHPPAELKMVRTTTKEGRPLNVGLLAYNTNDQVFRFERCKEIVNSLCTLSFRYLRQCSVSGKRLRE